MIQTIEVDEIWHHSAIVSIKWVELNRYVTKHWLREYNSDDKKILYEELTYHEAKKRYKEENKTMPGEWHLRRVLYIAKNGWNDPILIEIEGDDSYQIYDGNHRLVAAIFLNHKTIKVEFFGFVDNIENIFSTLEKFEKSS